MNARLEGKLFWRRTKPKLAHVQISTWEGEGGSECFNGICYANPLRQKLEYVVDVIRVAKAVFIKHASDYLASVSKNAHHGSVSSSVSPHA